MKLNTKVLLLLAALFATLGAIQFAIGDRILLPSFDRLEQQAAYTDMDRVSNAIQRDLEALYDVTEDYGNWNETYQFMQTANLAFINKDFTDDSIASLKINVAAFIANDGHFVWSTARVAGSSEPLKLDLLEGNRLPPGNPWSRLLGTTTRNTTGILKTNQGALLAVMAPILDGSGSGEPRGMLLFGKLLTDEVIARIGSQSQVTLTKSAFRPTDASDPSGRGTLSQDSDETIIRKPLKDALGETLFTLQIRVPRAISESGRDVVSMAWLLMGGGFIVVLLLIIVVLRATVLKPLGVLTDHAVSVGRSGDLTSRLDLHRRDEIGDLAREFDTMVRNLSETRQQLIDQSFDAGIAENASGVLHNLGNAMTPLSVRISAIGEKLRAAPAGDVALVLDELRRGNVDPSREAELLQFLKLVSGELAQTITDSAFDLQTATRQVAVMQTILDGQARHSSANRVMETVRLAELVTATNELITPTISSAMSIEMDDSVQQLGPMRLCRITLQQVIQNVLVNAAESAREKGLATGIVQVSASVTRTETGEQLEIRFADNGVGMSAEQLARFAEKGFTSKTHLAGRGIGLHWAANALHAMGGGIRAESAGRNCGACIQVTIPFERVTATPSRRVA